MPSKKQQACVTRYVSNHYDKITITVPKGERDRYKELAARLGVSVNQLFVQAVEQYIADRIELLGDVEKTDGASGALDFSASSDVSNSLS